MSDDELKNIGKKRLKKNNRIREKNLFGKTSNFFGKKPTLLT